MLRALRAGRLLRIASHPRRSLHNFRFRHGPAFQASWESWLARLAPRYYRRRLIRQRVPESFRAAFASLRPGLIAIDCGARVGAITEAMALSGARVFAFEPDPAAFDELCRLGRFTNVTLSRSAVSDHFGRERFYLAGESSSLFHEHNPRWDGSPPVEVDVIDLAPFISDLGSVHLLKLDIEGAEVAVLRRLLETGALQQVRHVFVEMHERMLPPRLAEEATHLRSVLAQRAPHVRLDWP